MDEERIAFEEIRAEWIVLLKITSRWDQTYLSDDLFFLEEDYSKSNSKKSQKLEMFIARGGPCCFSETLIDDGDWSYCLIVGVLVESYLFLQTKS